MKKFRLVVTIIIAVTMVASLLAGCGTPSNNSSGTTGTAASTTAAEVKTSFEQLLAMKDKLPLSGLQPLKLESRAGIEKAIPKEGKKNITIGWAGAFLGAPFFEELLKTAQAAAAKYGYTINYQNANFDIQKQFTQLDTFITQQVDIIVLNAVDIDASVQYMKRAVQAGIPIIVIGPTDSKADYPIITTIVSAAYDPGFEVGVYTAQKLYKEGEVLKVGATLANISDATSNSRPNGFIGGYLYESAKIKGQPYANRWDAVLDGYNIWVQWRDSGKFDATAKGLDLVGYGVGGGTDPAAGQKASQDLLTAHPDIDVLFVEQDSQLLGVMQEMKARNIVPGKDMQLVCAADGTKEAMDLIKAGTLMATASNSPSYYGESIVELIHDIYEEGYDANDMPANSYVPTQCLNAENVDQYYDPNYQFSKITPWEFRTIAEYNAANGQ